MIKHLIITNDRGDKKEVTKDSYFIYDKYFHFIRKVEWIYKDTNYVLQNIYAYCPFFDLQRIAVLHYDETEFKYPSNLVIYNADKTVFKIVSVPPFINEEVLKNRIIPDDKIERFEYFETIKEIDGRNYAIIAISTDAYMGSRMGQCTSIEMRALDIETGEFHSNWSRGGIYW